MQENFLVLTNFSTIAIVIAKYCNLSIRVFALKSQKMGTQQILEPK